MDKLPWRRSGLFELRRHAGVAPTQSRVGVLSTQPKLLGHSDGGVLTMTITRQIAAALAAIAVLSSACADVTVPNYNNPSLEQLTNTPTASTVNTAAIGMLINLRG